MRIPTILLGFFLLSGCAAPIPGPSVFGAPLERGVHSGEKDQIDYYESLYPNCESEGFPEVTVIKAASHGTVSSAPGEDYPNFVKDNVRYDCNRKRVPSTQVFYQSNANYHGKDSFTIEVRFPGSHLRTAVYVVEVR